MTASIRLIVGLGNPGTDYANTRHNAGADWVSELARLNGASLSSDPKFFGHIARVTIAGQDVRLLNPTTFMNRSGQSVAAVAKFFKIEPSEILVAHDELDLSPGIAKLKQGGGHGGHNGLRDIIAALGNNKNFYRLRIGIGHPGNSAQVANFVLKRASRAEQDLIDAASDKAGHSIEDIVAGNFAKAMKDLHSK